ncbi:MAG: hypothetical protein EA361_05050 [Bacteroidetes bacterium]|nr:MAG: hypothetical protein EA361_05050 [Bacteroidota bacterium]
MHDHSQAYGPKNKKPNPFEGSGWLAQGITFAIILFVLMFVVYPLVMGEELTLKSILAGLISSSLGGLIYGLAMKWLNRKKVIKG